MLSPGINQIKLIIYLSAAFMLSPGIINIMIVVNITKIIYSKYRCVAKMRLPEGKIFLTKPPKSLLKFS